jgi:hypothetical protein
VAGLGKDGVCAPARHHSSARMPSILRILIEADAAADTA